MCKICKSLFKQQAVIAWWIGNQWEAQAPIKAPNKDATNGKKYAKKHKAYSYREKKHQRELGYRLNKRNK